MNESAYKRYFLVLLALILAFNYVDLRLMGLVLQDIKVDLSLTDTQLGLLTGMAFSLFYAFMGIPIARWADRGNRATIITLTTALWSVAVVLCATAASFWQLLLIRIGVAVGEAGCAPPAHSLIADYFSRAERAKAVATYTLGVPLSVLIGYFLGGWMNQLYGWRATFALLGLPGLLLAVIAWCTLREPRLNKSKQETAESARTQPRLKEVFDTLWRISTFRHLVLFFSLLNLFGYGIMQWLPSFFIRSFGLSTGELGTWLAVIFGVGGIVGTYAGGVWASHFVNNDERRQLRTLAVLYFFYTIVNICVYFSSSYHVAIGLLTLGSIAVHIVSAPLYATLQSLVPERMRAMSIAIVYFCFNLIGMGLGPLLAGVLSDVLRSWAGEESLRYALLALSPGYLWAAWHLWRASKTVLADMEATLRYQQSAPQERARSADSPEQAVADRA